VPDLIVELKDAVGAAYEAHQRHCVNAGIGTRKFAPPSCCPSTPCSPRPVLLTAAMLERLERQKKLTANQWRIILTTNLGDMLA